MPELTGSFGVALTAFTQVDKPSLQRAEKAVGESFGRATSGQTKGAQAARDVVKQGAAESTRFGLSIRSIRESLNATWHTAGLGKAVEQFREARTAASEFHEQAEKTSKLFGGAAEGLMGLAGVAGLGLAVRQFASSAGEISRTAASFGVSTSTLQGIRGAAALSGVDSGAATSAVGSLQKSLYAAKYGLPEGAAARAMANYLGLDVSQSPDKFLEQLADKIAGQKNAQTQGKMAEAFGVEAFLPHLRKGPAEMRRLNDETERHNHLSQKQIDQGLELEHAYHGAEQSTVGFANALSAQLAPSIAPVLTSFSTWLDDLKQSPEKMKAIEIGADLLAVTIGITLVSALAKATRAVLAFNAAWAAGPLIVATALAEIGAFTPPIPHYGKNEGDEKLENLPAPSGYGPKRWWNPFDWITGHGQPSYTIGSGGRQGASRSPANAAELTAAGLNPDLLPIVQRESKGNPLIGWGQTDLSGYSLSDTGFPQWPGKMGPEGNSTAAGILQITRSTWDPIARDLGISDFSLASQIAVGNELYRRRGYRPWGGAPATASYGTGFHPGDPAPPEATMSPDTTGAQGLSDYYREHGGFLGDPGWHGGEEGQYIPIGGGDSHHHIEITAPAGYGASIRKSKGPADVTLRTQTAFSSP